ncbi:MAG: hypothetical protein DLM69_01870 [Candidatus Chloroheliales bacterium]|nr:MAG: hypothetical protein DLM69_01870 [Chloroflexota bacterium]
MPPVLVGRRIIGSAYDNLTSASSAGQHSFADSYNSTYFYSTDMNLNKIAASSGLLFLLRNEGDGNLFGNTRLFAFDLNSGKQVWRSPTSSGDYFSGNQFIIGNGMLYRIYGGEVHAFAGAR